MFSFFKRKKTLPTITDYSFLACDIHSHIIPGIDDGAATIEESVEMIVAFKELGFSKLITTPHIYGDYYKNNNQTIEKGLELVKNRPEVKNAAIELTASAEYYLDGYFRDVMYPQKLRTFGNDYVLVEVSMLSWPFNARSILFELQLAGYRPILAHPERYNVQDKELFRELKEKNVYMQLNLMSIWGHYGPEIKKTADLMLHEGLYDFCGTDAHNMRHLQSLKSAFDKHPEAITKLAEYNFRNKELL